MIVSAALVGGLAYHYFYEKRGLVLARNFLATPASIDSSVSIQVKVGREG
jgi:hypothetical protein